MKVKGPQIINPHDLGLLSAADYPKEPKVKSRTTECERCGKEHTYPDSDYYDLCRACALAVGFEDDEYDWRTET